MFLTNAVANLDLGLRRSGRVEGFRGLGFRGLGFQFAAASRARGFGA